MRNNILHKTSAPYHPATNGQVERYVQVIKQKLRTLENEKGDIELKVCQILMDFRRLVHPATKKSPAMSMFGRQIRSRLDLIKFVPKKRVFEDKKIIKYRQLNLNQKVSAREYQNKNCKWKFGRVFKKLGKYHYLVRLDDGRIWKRHIDQMRSVGDEIYDSSQQVPYLINSVTQLKKMTTIFR